MVLLTLDIRVFIAGNILAAYSAVSHSTSYDQHGGLYSIITRLTSSDLRPWTMFHDINFGIDNKRCTTCVVDGIMLR